MMSDSDTAAELQLQW